MAFGPITSCFSVERDFRILTYVILDIVQNKAINRTKPFIAFCQMIIAANLRFLRRGYFDLMAWPVQNQQTIRSISDQNRNRNKLAYFTKLCYFIAKLYVISKLIWDSFSIENPLMLSYFSFNLIRNLPNAELFL